MIERDRARVAGIDRYRVLTGPPRSALLALVEVAAQVARVPMATINLVTDTEQHQVATHGFDASVCSRADSMCNAVLDEGGPVIVPDASRDARFKDNPFVTGPIGHVRFYATHPLVTPEGVVIGSLCVFDTEPRSLSDEQEHALVSLAGRVVDVLELELRSRELTASLVEVERAHAELERSNEQLAAFAGQVSHDLRNPLTAVSLSLRMIAEHVEDATPDTDEATVGWLAARAIGGADRMRNLIDELLSFARLGGELARVDVDLARVVEDVREDLATALVGAEVTVGELPTVTGDPVQLRAVLQNLVANAAKFTRPTEKPEITVRACRGAGRWRIEVVDRGVGIPAGERSRVFEPFARVHHTVPGSGIGLATVRRAVEAHGGAVGITPTPGGGTTVWFELPIGG